MHKEF